MFQCEKAATPICSLAFRSSECSWRMLTFTSHCSATCCVSYSPAFSTGMLAKASYPGVRASFFVHCAPCFSAACSPLPSMWPTLQTIFSGVYIDEEISVIPGAFRPEQEHACAKWTQSNAGDLFQQRCCWGGARTLRFFCDRLESGSVSLGTGIVATKPPRFPFVC